MHDGEQFLTLAQIRARIPGAKGAKNVNTSTITRWITHGCPSRTGERVKLAATRAGIRWLVFPSDLEHFFAALAGEDVPAPTETPSAAARRKAVERAEKELEAAGC